jgi:hypothetical protein
MADGSQWDPQEFPWRKSYSFPLSPETKVAVFEDDQLVEVYFERGSNIGLVGESTRAV